MSIFKELFGDQGSFCQLCFGVSSNYHLVLKESLGKAVLSRIKSLRLNDKLFYAQ